MDIYVSSLFLGPVRLCLFFLFVSLVFRLVSLRVSDQTGFDYFIPRFTICFSFLVVLSLVLTQINAFDPLVLLFILTIIILRTLLNIDPKKKLIPQLNRIYNRLILYVVRRSERNEQFITRKNFRNKLKRTPVEEEKINHRKWKYIIGFLLAISAFLSRYLFLKYDSYALSKLWNIDLLNIIFVSNHQWFIEGNTMMGDYAIIKIYSWITGISDPVALESIGILQSVLLTLIIYWIVYRLTKENYTPALISALSFVFLYPLLPLNLDLITQHKPVFMALTPGLPAMFLLATPQIVRFKSKPYLCAMSLTFLAVFLLDLFVAVVIIPPFIILAFIAAFFHHRRYILRGILAYLIALGAFILIYGLNGILTDGTLEEFFIANLYSLTTYTYTPHLLLNIEDLIKFYKWGLIILLLPIMVLYSKDRKKWFPVLLFTAYFLLLTLLYEVPFVDIDLLTESMAVFMPLTFGLAFYVLIKIIPFIKVRRPAPLFQLFIAVSMVLIVFRATGGQKVSEIPYERNIAKEQILNAYKRFDRLLLPLSYAVVNQRSNHVYSKSHRNFIDYEYFIRDYMVQDLLYFRNKDNRQFLSENPHINLPNSTFVFLYKKGVDAGNDLEIDWEIQREVVRSLEVLKRRGREIKVFYDPSELKIIEIVNKPNSSRIENMLLN